MEELKKNLKQQAETIVKRGQHIRQEIARISSEAAQRCQREAEGLLGLAQAVLDGAVAGIRGKLPDQTQSVLCEVIDGLGDAFATSAHAVQLTLQEAKSAGKTFAREDLDKIVHEFRSVGELFVDTVDHALVAVRDQAASQSGALRDHAGRALSRAQAGMESAMHAARRDFGQLSKETLQAGLAAGRCATGIFFSEVGKRMQKVGEKMNPSRPQ